VVVVVAEVQQLKDSDGGLSLFSNQTAPVSEGVSEEWRW